MTDDLRMQLARIAFDHDTEGAFAFEPNEAYWLDAADEALESVSEWLVAWADKQQALGWDGDASEVRRAAQALRRQKAAERTAPAVPDSPQVSAKPTSDTRGAA